MSQTWENPTERELFDAWRRSLPNGVVFDAAIEPAWLAWQAAREQTTQLRRRIARLEAKVGPWTLSGVNADSIREQAQAEIKRRGPP